MAYRVTEDLVIAQNPDDYLVYETKETTMCDMPVYEGGHPKDVCEDVTFLSTSLEGDVSILEELLRCLKSDYRSPMLVGPPGTAKNTSINKVSSMTNLPVYREQMGEGNTKYDIISTAHNREGETVTVLQEVGKAAVFGGIAVIDEINLASNRLIANLNSMFEQDENRQIELPGSGKTLKELPDDVEWDREKHLGEYIHPAFYVVATRNPPTHSGASVLNSALNDRFSTIRYDYLEPDYEAELMASDIAEPVDKDDIKMLVKMFNTEVREPRKNNNGIQEPISYRRIMDAIQYSVTHDVTLYNAIRAKIVNSLQSQSDRDKLENIILEYKNKLRVVPKKNKERRTACTNCSWVSKDPENRIMCPECNAPVTSNHVETWTEVPEESSGPKGRFNKFAIEPVTSSESSWDVYFHVQYPQTDDESVVIYQNVDYDVENEIEECIDQEEPISKVANNLKVEYPSGEHTIETE